VEASLPKQSVKFIACPRWTHAPYLSWKCTFDSSFTSFELSLADFLLALKLYSLLVVVFEIARFHQDLIEEPIRQILVVGCRLRRHQLAPLPVDGGFHCEKKVQLWCCAFLGLAAWTFMLIYLLLFRFLILSLSIHSSRHFTLKLKRKIASLRLNLLQKLELLHQEQSLP